MSKTIYGEVKAMIMKVNRRIVVKKIAVRRREAIEGRRVEGRRMNGKTSKGIKRRYDTLLLVVPRGFQQVGVPSGDTN